MALSLLAAIVGGIAIAIGVVWALFGFRLSRLAGALGGAIVGAGAGYAIGDAWWSEPGALLGAIGGALVLGVLLYKLYWLGSFFAGVAVGVVVVAAIFGAGVASLVGGLVLGTLLGILAAKLHRPVVIALTAIGGAWMAAAGVVPLVHQLDAADVEEVLRTLGTDLVLTLAIAAPLAAVGAWYQVRTTRPTAR